MKKSKLFIFFFLCFLLRSTTLPLPVFAASCQCTVSEYVQEAGGAVTLDGEKCVDVDPATGCTPDNEGDLKVIPGTQFSDKNGKFTFSGCTSQLTSCLSAIAKDCAIADDCQIMPGTRGKVECTNGTCMVDSVLAQYWENTGAGFGRRINFEPPKLAIDIPGVNFSSTTLLVDKEGFLTIPYLVEYIKGIYKFLVIIGSIVAAIVVILNGFRITASAGGEAKGEGIKRVGQAIVGLFILWSSYAILYTINPALTQLSAIRVKYIIPENDFVYTGGGESGTGITASVSNEKSTHPVSSDLQAIFYRYSQCDAPGPAVLTELARVESGLRPNIVNSLGFTGLFQTKARYCLGALNNFPNVAGYCTDLTNPEISTMVGASMLRSSLDTIKNNCGDIYKIEESVLITLIYTGHQSGNGALRAITANMKNNCTVTGLKKALVTFWSMPKNVKTLQTSKRTAEEVADEAINTAARMVKLVDRAGGVQLKKEEDMQRDKLCPLDVPELRFQNK